MKLKKIIRQFVLALAGVMTAGMATAQRGIVLGEEARFRKKDILTKFYENNVTDTI